MNSKILSILNNSKFFHIIKATNSSVNYTLEKSSQILIRNIYMNWLRYLNVKAHKVMPIYIQQMKHDHDKTKAKSKLPFGILNHSEFDFSMPFKYEGEHLGKMELNLKLMIPQHDRMQYFIQWQRYRKYWWSSITTTPSLFSVGDIKQGDNEASADIVATLPCGVQTVEHIKINNHDNEYKDTACLTCTMSLERALFILLLDGLNESTDDYLRLHRKIAPYKMSFGLNIKDPKNKETLKDLATLLLHRLKPEKISAYIPDFSNTFEDQIKENLHMGIPYTAILNESTLENGIFHLMNSSTMIKEQTHVADFNTYAALICSDK